MTSYKILGRDIVICCWLNSIIFGFVYITRYVCTTNHSMGGLVVNWRLGFSKRHRLLSRMGYVTHSSDHPRAPINDSDVHIRINIRA